MRATRMLCNAMASQPLTVSTVNPLVRTAEYAVRGELVLRAMAHEEALRSTSADLPFEKLVYCNIGNPQSLQQAPVSFARQVLAMCDCPDLLDAGIFPADAVARARAYLAAVPSVLAVSRVPLSVRQVQVGGEALTQAAVKNVHASASIFNYYGPTEASVWATRCPVGRADQSTRLSSIGIALPNVRCYVVSNGSMPELLPPGSHGELWLGGVQLARGYLNRLDITAERFVSNPWAPSESTMDAIAYRTGDRVRWSSDSELDFAGCAEGEGSKPMEASA